MFETIATGKNENYGKKNASHFGNREWHKDFYRIVVKIYSNGFVTSARARVFYGII